MRKNLNGTTKNGEEAQEKELNFVSHQGKATLNHNTFIRKAKIKT